jgi:dTDP-4-dehydrorhamnose reductase
MVRVRDAFRDQLRETGHHDRPEDIAAVAGLGIRKLRYAAAWERIAPDRPDACDWSWQDARMAELRRHGIEPILGLVHHGSGPAHASMDDPRFPEELARYAGLVARRYPWVKDWTPVNEPLTTARFSGLYGFWYPHGESEAEFLRLLVNECRGVVLAMRAIREVIPDARLVQTEDLGRNFGTAPMRAKVEEYNERRWLSFDLVLGRVDAAHPWHGRFLAAGVSEAELRSLREQPPGPTLLGINHYVTSDRFLDHRMGFYPVEIHEPSPAQGFIDTEAIRAGVAVEELGWGPRLRETAERFPGLPIAVTEVHLGCCPENQMRWLLDCWNAAVALRTEGVDVEAVTIWSLAGAVDWSSLLTERRGDYEPGLLDASAPGGARLTALAGAVQDLARDGHFGHAALAERGWWVGDGRLHVHLREAS